MVFKGHHLIGKTSFKKFFFFRALPKLPPKGGGKYANLMNKLDLNENSSAREDLKNDNLETLEQFPNAKM